MLNPITQIPRIDVWFRSEVSRWRSGAALVWTIALTTPIVYLTLMIANISLLHPFQWICSSFLQVFTAATWPYAVFITLATAVSAVQRSKQFTVVPVLYSTRLERYTNIVHLSSLYYLACSSVLCGTVAWSYTGLVGGQYHKLSKQCDDTGDAICLNEHHLFIVMHGICLGACCKLSSLLSGNSHLVFPIIQQSKFFQMKISAFPLVMNSILRSLHHLKYFYIVYYLVIGTTVQQFFYSNVGLGLSSNIAPINSISGMFNVSLLWHTLLSGTLILSLLSLSARLFKLYHTECYEFPIETSMEQYKHLCLYNALSCQHNNFVQYLGYQDLHRLSKHSPARRQQVFCLTQLGGHPQNWSNLSKQCLGLLKDFVDEVKAYNVKAMADGSMKHLTAESGLIQGSSGTGLRQRNGTNEPAEITRKKPTKPTASQMLMTDLKKKKLIAYFMAEEPDVCSRKLFARAQLYIWAVDALSHLTCASYTEDKFGVVQKSLPEIIETLLHLQEQVEKHYRLMSNIGKRPETDDDTDTALRNSLKSTLKAAIYRIITTFDNHVRSVPLSGDHMRRLSHFLDYKE